MHRKRFSWTALVAVALVGIVAVSAATALASRSAASPFELVATDRYVAECYECLPHVGTFTSSAPFCESGTLDHIGLGRVDEVVRSYACGDGSGSLTLTQRGRGERGDWTIVEGSGRYADLRGKGVYSSRMFTEAASGDPEWVVQTTLQGFADADAIVPSASFTKASATKLSRAPGAYAIRVALSLRDDVEGNPVAYSLRVKEGPEHPRDRWLHDLGWREGTTASGSLSTTLRVWPSSKRVRVVQLLLNASDPVGNEVTLVRSLKLPR